MSRLKWRAGLLALTFSIYCVSGASAQSRSSASADPKLSYDLASTPSGEAVLNQAELELILPSLPGSPVSTNTELDRYLSLRSVSFDGNVYLVGTGTPELAARYGRVPSRKLVQELYRTALFVNPDRLTPEFVELAVAEALTEFMNEADAKGVEFGEECSKRTGTPPNVQCEKPEPCALLDVGNGRKVRPECIPSSGGENNPGVRICVCYFREMHGCGDAPADACWSGGKCNNEDGENDYEKAKCKGEADKPDPKKNYICVLKEGEKVPPLDKAKPSDLKGKCCCTSNTATPTPTPTKTPTKTPTPKPTNTPAPTMVPTVPSGPLVPSTTTKAKTAARGYESRQGM